MLGNQGQSRRWSSLDQTALDVTLPRDMVFHSVFACPVSQETASAKNPPVLLKCNHVICKSSMLSLTRRGQRYVLSYLFSPLAADKRVIAKWCCNLFISEVWVRECVQIRFPTQGYRGWICSICYLLICNHVFAAAWPFCVGSICRTGSSAQRAIVRWSLPTCLSLFCDEKPLPLLVKCDSLKVGFLALAVR